MNHTRIQRLTGTALVAASLFTLGACGSSAGSDGAKDTTTTTAADAAFVVKVNAACAADKTAVDASNKEAESATPADGIAITIAAQKANVTRLEALSTSVDDAGPTTAAGKAFMADIAALPGAYEELNSVSAPLYGPTELTSEQAAELEKKLEKPTDEVTNLLAQTKAKAEKAGLTDCVAMVKAMEPMGS